MQAVAKLLEAQREIVAASDGSPDSLDKFTSHTDEGNFDHWIKCFEERAKIASWNG